MSFRFLERMDASFHINDVIITRNIDRVPTLPPNISDLVCLPSILLRRHQLRPFFQHFYVLIARQYQVLILSIVLSWRKAGRPVVVNILCLTSKSFLKLTGVDH